MNVSSILNQLMKPVGGQSSGQGAGAGMDLGKMVDSLATQLKGAQGSAGGIDLRSLLGGGALGLLIGSKRGRKMGGTALKYGALAGPALEQRGLEILQAMIMAARADGHVDADEQNPMERAWLDQLAAALKLPPGMAQELDRQVQTATRSGAGV